MTVSTIAEILDMQAGDTVEAVRGTIRKIWPQKEAGRGMLQSIVLKDGKDELTCKLWDIDPVDPKWVNRELILTAGEKDMKLDEYKGDLQLMVHRDAELALAGRERNGGSQRTRDKRDEYLPTEEKQEEPAKKETAREHAARIANTWLIAYQAARYARQQIKEQLAEELTVEQFQALTATISIRLMDDGFHQNMPAIALRLSKTSQKSEDHAGPTPQQQLADLIIKAKFTFDDFQSWALETGNLEEELPGFVDVPTKKAEHFIQNIEGILKSLNDNWPPGPIQ